MSMSKGGQGYGSRTSQNGTSGVDPTTFDFLQRIMQAAQAAGAAGPSPLLNGAAGYNTSAMDAGTTGLKALGGDQSAITSLMNPYTSNVIQAMRDQAGVTNANTINQVNDAATRANAFGGTRQGVTTGTMLSQNARDLNSNIAGLLSSGYNNAMGQAATAAGFGANASGANAGLGLNGVGSPEQWLLQMLRQGFVMPTGAQSSGTQATTGDTFGGQAGFKFPFLS